MFPLRYWANRFFNPRYWPIVGADAVVSERYDLIGTAIAKKALVGTSDEKFGLEGAIITLPTIQGS